MKHDTFKVYVGYKTVVESEGRRHETLDYRKKISTTQGSYFHADKFPVSLYGSLEDARLAGERHYHDRQGLMVGIKIIKCKAYEDWLIARQIVPVARANNEKVGPHVTARLVCFFKHVEIVGIEEQLFRSPAGELEWREATK